MLISFLIPSRNTFFLRRFLNSLEKNTFEKDQIEVLIKLDEDKDYTDFINDTKQNYNFSVKFLVSPRLEGQPSLWFAVEQLYKLSNTNSYFVQILSDEPYIETYEWDKILLNYKNYFKDDIFRLRTSKLKYFNYSNEFDCVTKPDSYPIYTRKWLDLTLGTGECWGSDAYQQLIAYYLSLGPVNYLNFQNRSGAISRDIPIDDIKYKGLEWGVGVKDDQLEYMRKYMLHEWKRLISKKSLENISYKSMRIFLYIYAKSLNLKKFKIVQNGNCVELIDNQDNFVILKITFKVFPKFFSNYQKFMLFIISKFGIVKFNFYNSNRTNIRVKIKSIFIKFISKFYFIISSKKLKIRIKNILINTLDKLLFLKENNNNKWLLRNKMLYNPFPTSPKIIFIKNVSEAFYKKNFKLNYDPPGFQFLNYLRNIKVPKEIKKISKKQIEYTKEQIDNLQNFKKKLEEKNYE